MKGILFVVAILIILQINCIVFAQDEVYYIDPSENIETQFYDYDIDNDWDLYLNNNKIENDDIVISPDSFYHSPYIYLRGFVESSDGNINWDKTSGNIEFNFNGDKYLITNSSYKCIVKTAPSFFEIRYVYIRNITKNKYIIIDDNDTLPLYVMNNRSYIKYSVFELISDLSNCDSVCDIYNKEISVKKYNYDKNFITEKIKKNMSYSELIGVLGRNDYFELSKNGECKVRYMLDKGYVEMTFSSYTDDSDMKLIRAVIKDQEDNVLEVII